MSKKEYMDVHEKLDFILLEIACLRSMIKTIDITNQRRLDEIIDRLDRAGIDS